MNNTVVRFPKPRDLEPEETAASLDHWQTQFKVYAKRDPLMAPFLTDTWNPNAEDMGFTEAAGGVDAVTRGENCKLFLSHLASFFKVPYYNKAIQTRTTSLESVWDYLRQMYNVEKSADTMIDIGTLVYTKSESYASFYAKIVYFIEMNLAPPNCTTDNVNTGVEGDKLSVTLMDLAAVYWLGKIAPRLYERVKQDYAVQIKQGIRLSQLVPQIAKAIPGILNTMDRVRSEVVRQIAELNIGQDENDEGESMNTQIRKLNGNNFPRRQNRPKRAARAPQQNAQKSPTCSHCNWLKNYLKIREVDDNHPTSACTRRIPNNVLNMLKDADSALEASEEESDEQGEKLHTKNLLNSSYFQESSKQSRGSQPPASKAQDRLKEKLGNKKLKSCSLSEKELQALRIRALRLQRKAKSPRMLVTCRGSKTPMLIDEGSELNVLDGDFARKKDIRLAPTTQSATAAGNKNLTILGVTEHDLVVDTMFQSTHVPINLGRVTVVDNLGIDIIIGEPGKAQNGITTDPKHRVIFLEQEGRIFSKPYHTEDMEKPRVCRIESGPVTLYQDDELIIPVPEEMQDKEIAIVPRKDYTQYFQPRVMQVGSTVSLPNISDLPVTIKRHSHVVDFRFTNIEDAEKRSSSSISAVHAHTDDKFKYKPTAKKVEPPDLESIKIDPDRQMPEEMRMKFYEVNKAYSDVFSTTPGRYTGHFGDISTSLQFTSPPVQTRKVAVPAYGMEMKQKMAQKMDEMYDQGILLTPDEVGVTIEFMSPSLLVPKPDGGTRLVSDFTGLNRFIKRTPTVSPTIREAREDLSRKKYFVELDLANYFFQGGMRREDIAWLGVMHPFRGPMVYTASPQGLRNSSEVSYDRLARIFGTMMQESRLTRMADGIFVLADSYEELLDNYVETLQRLRLSGLTLKPSKCVIAPTTAVIFGWQLKEGKWSPQSHVVSSLTRAERPVTFKQLRSFNGAVKQLSSCIKNYAVLLHPLEKIIGSRGSSEKVTWTDELEKAFNEVKKAIANPEAIVIPRPDDKLVTSSDFSKQMGAVGGMLTIIRKNKDGSESKFLGGFFSVKLSDGRSLWFPCDGEALATKLVLEFFAHYIRENVNETLHLTDSMPVVQAWKKLTTGRFSTSPKITTFLSTLATLPVRVEHRPGSHMLLADHASRHPPEPCKGECDTCKYVNDQVSIGNNIKIFKIDDDGEAEEFVKDEETVPWLQLKTWKTIQMNDPVHTKLMTLIKTGQEPEKRKTGGDFTILKHLHTLYVRNSLKIHRSVIMVKTKTGAFDGYSISVPENLFKGLAFAFHNRLHHPKKTQLEKLMSRYFFVTAMPAAIEQVTDNCLQCLSTKRLPKALVPETTTIPQGFGTRYSGDVMERCGQSIFICKEILSQFVTTTITPDQTIPSMRDAIVTATAPTISMSGAEIRLDSAPAFQSIAKNLEKDPIFDMLKLKISLGEPLNRNHNPVAEATVAEIKKELLNLSVQNQPLTPAILALATRNLNSRIRSEGKSAMELMTGRDAFTNKNFDLNDSRLMENLQERREIQHRANEKNKSKFRHEVEIKVFKEGDIVMYREMVNLDYPRDTFVVVEDDGSSEVKIRKLSKQLRLKTYSVKREQLVLIFSSADLKDHPSLSPPPTPPPTPAPRRSARTSSKKATLNLKELSSKGVIMVKEKRKIKKDEKYVYIFVQEPVPPNDDLIDFSSDSDNMDDNLDDDQNIDDEQDNDDSSTTSSEPDISDDEHDELQPQLSNDDETDDPISEGENDVFYDNNTDEHDELGNNPFDDLEHLANANTSVMSDDRSSLEWDNDSMLVNLSSKLDRSIFSVLQMVQEAEEVSPVLEVPTSPISPFRRVTRRLVSSGRYNLLSNTSSESLGPTFVRNSTFRTNLPRVQFVNDDIQEIADSSSAAHAPSQVQTDF